MQNSQNRLCEFVHQKRAAKKTVGSFVGCEPDEETCIVFPGEKLSAEEVEDLLVGQEDAQGNVNYEGKSWQCFTLSRAASARSAAC